MVRAVRSKASGGGVQCHLVVGHAVDSLHDVDLAVLWPVDALRPDTRPYLYREGVVKASIPGEVDRHEGEKTHRAAPR